MISLDKDRDVSMEFDDDEEPPVQQDPLTVNLTNLIEINSKNNKQTTITNPANSDRPTVKANDFASNRSSRKSRRSKRGSQRPSDITKGQDPGQNSVLFDFFKSLDFNPAQ